LADQQVKAEIARPANGETVPAGSSYRMHGAAWGGEIAKVEVSVDSGTIWTIAQLLGQPVKNAWRLWQYDWQTPTEPGRKTVMARATDSRGLTQSFDRSADRGTYMINHLLPIEVEVR
jgi:hypothetical protein